MTCHVTFITCIQKREFFLNPWSASKGSLFEESSQSAHLEKFISSWFHHLISVNQWNMSLQICDLKIEIELFFFELKIDPCTMSGISITQKANSRLYPLCIYVDISPKVIKSNVWKYINIKNAPITKIRKNVNYGNKRGSWFFTEWPRDHKL